MAHSCCLASWEGVVPSIVSRGKVNVYPFYTNVKSKNCKSNHYKLRTVCSIVFALFFPITYQLIIQRGWWVRESVFLRLGHWLFIFKMEMRQPPNTGTSRARIKNPTHGGDPLARTLLPECLTLSSLPMKPHPKPLSEVQAKHLCPVGSLSYSSQWKFIRVSLVPLLWLLSHINLNRSHLGGSLLPS